LLFRTIESITKNKWSCFMLKRRESIKNGRDSLPVCAYSDSDILVFDFVQNMTEYNFVRFHFDGLLVSEDEREDVAEPNAFADLMLSKPAERVFQDGTLRVFARIGWRRINL